MPFLFLLYVISYLDRINVGFAGLQMTGELHFSDAVFGFGSGVFFVGYMILGIPGGIIVEKWSARKTMTATMLVWGAVASASGFIHTERQFYVMRFILGLAEAPFLPGVLTYLGHWYRPVDRAKAVAMFMVAIPVAQAVASPLAAWLLRIEWLGLSGWRWLLILEGIPAIIGAFIAWFFLTDRPHHAHWLTPDQRFWLAGEIERGYRKTDAPERETIWQAVRHPGVLLFCLAYVGGTTGSYGLNLWLPKMLQKLGHLSLVETSLLAAIPATVAIPSMLILGWNSDRTRERKLHASIPRLLAGIAMAGVVLAGNNVLVALTLLSVATAGILGAYGPIWAIPNTFLSRGALAASNGLITSLGNLGGFIGPFLIGYLSTRTGSYSAGLLGMAILVAGCSLLVLPLGKRPSRSPGPHLSSSHHRIPLVY